MIDLQTQICSTNLSREVIGADRAIRPHHRGAFLAPLQHHPWGTSGNQRCLQSLRRFIERGDAHITPRRILLTSGVGRATAGRAGNRQEDDSGKWGGGGYVAGITPGVNPAGRHNHGHHDTQMCDVCRHSEAIPCGAGTAPHGMASECSRPNKWTSHCSIVSRVSWHFEPDILHLRPLIGRCIMFHAEKKMKVKCLEVSTKCLI